MSQQVGSEAVKQGGYTPFLLSQQKLQQEQPTARDMCAGKEEGREEGGEEWVKQMEEERGKRKVLSMSHNTSTHLASLKEPFSPLRGLDMSS